jgi:hypothetical protein
VRKLIERAEGLGVAHQGFEGGGPHRTRTSRDWAAALFVTSRALELARSFVELNPRDVRQHQRADIHKARNVLRGGRADSAAGADQDLALKLASAAIGKTLGIGCPAVGSFRGVRLLRGAFSKVFGSIFLAVPPDDALVLHLNEASRAAKALAARRAREVSRVEFNDLIDLAAATLATDAIWAAHEATKARSVNEDVFRFPMTDGDKTRRQLLKRLQTRLTRGR